MDNIFLPNQRIIILQGLEKDAGRTLSNEMLQRLLKSYGHSVSLADVNALKIAQFVGRCPARYDYR